VNESADSGKAGSEGSAERALGADREWERLVPKIQARRAQRKASVRDYWLYRADYPPAHLHAQYGEHWAKIAIGTGRVIEGSPQESASDDPRMGRPAHWRAGGELVASTRR
jgi:uncharacterized protein DUF4160